MLDCLAAFVNRFAPGKLLWVDAPHFMEAAVPGQIARAVREVDHLADASQVGKGELAHVEGVAPRVPCSRQLREAVCHHG